jgi:hypothetical protein
LEGKLTSNIITWYRYISRMQRKDPKEGSEHVSESKMPKRKTVIKIAKGSEIC